MLRRTCSMPCRWLLGCLFHKLVTIMNIDNLVKERDAAIAISVEADGNYLKLCEERDHLKRLQKNEWYNGFWIGMIWGVTIAGTLLLLEVLAIKCGLLTT